MGFDLIGVMMQSTLPPNSSPPNINYYVVANNIGRNSTIAALLACESKSQANHQCDLRLRKFDCLSN